MNRIQQISGHGLTLTHEVIQGVGQFINERLIEMFKAASVKREQPLSFSHTDFIPFPLQEMPWLEIPQNDVFVTLDEAPKLTLNDDSHDITADTRNSFIQSYSDTDPS